MFWTGPHRTAHDHGYVPPVFVPTIAQPGVPEPGGGCAFAQTDWPSCGGVVPLVLVPQPSEQKPCAAPAITVTHIGALAGHGVWASHTLPRPIAAGFGPSGIMVCASGWFWVDLLLEHASNTHATTASLITSSVAPRPVRHHVGSQVPGATYWQMLFMQTRPPGHCPRFVLFSVPQPSTQYHVNLLFIAGPWIEHSGVPSGDAGIDAAHI